MGTEILTTETTEIIDTIVTSELIKSLLTEANEVIEMSNTTGIDKATESFETETNDELSTEIITSKGNDTLDGMNEVNLIDNPETELKVIENDQKSVARHAKQSKKEKKEK